MDDGEKSAGIIQWRWKAEHCWKVCLSLTTIDVLLIEDNEDEARLVRQAATTIVQPAVHMTWVQCLSDGMNSLTSHQFDAVLLDLTLPDSSSFETVRRTREAFPELAIVVVSNLADDQLATSVLRAGAQDFLVKHAIRHDLLLRSLLYAIEKKHNDVMAQERDDLIFILAHDLTVPLIGTERAISMIVKGAMSRESTSHTLEAVLRSNQRNLDMVHNLLYLYRLQHDSSAALHVMPTYLGSTIYGVVLDLQKLASDKNVKLDVQNLGRLDEVNVDEMAIARVLFNLVHNAVKFSSVDGTVEIKAGNVEDGVFVSVSDHGSGIPIADQVNLFRRFWQRDDMRRHSNGTGLGLYVCGQIVHSHNGSITCLSEPGNGSTFTIWLPRVEAASTGPDNLSLAG